MTATTPRGPAPPPDEFGPADRAAALALLHEPAPLDRIVAHLRRLGIVGDDGDILLAYLALISRRLPRPIPILLDSGGKPSAVTALLGLLPKDAGFYCSDITERALFRAGRKYQHCVLALGEEAVVRAKHALKLLLRDGDIALVGAARGRAKARRDGVVTYGTEGPIALLLDAGEHIDPELAELCLVLHLSGEAGTPTRRAAWRELQSREDDPEVAARNAIRRTHRAIEALIEPLPIPNAFHSTLDPPAQLGPAGCHFPATVQALELLRNGQRGTDAARRGDPGAGAGETSVQIALRLLRGVGPRPIRELPAATLSFLAQLRAAVAELAAAQDIKRSQINFTSRQIHELTGVSRTAVHVHLRRLVDFETVREARRQGRTIVYQLAELGPALQLEEPDREAAWRSAARDSGHGAPRPGENSDTNASNSEYFPSISTPNSDPSGSLQNPAKSSDDGAFSRARDVIDANEGTKFSPVQEENRPPEPGSAPPPPGAGPPAPDPAQSPASRSFGRAAPLGREPSAPSDRSRHTPTPRGPKRPRAPFGTHNAPGAPRRP